MHIVHIETGGGSGGQPLRTVNESLGMIKRGHKITIICPESIYLNTAARHAGLNVVNLPLVKKNWVNFKKLRTWFLVHRNEIDVINCHNSIDTWLCALVSMTLSIAPIIRTRHSSGEIRKNIANRWLFSRKCSHIVTTGEALRLQYSAVGVPLSQSTSVPSGVDIQRFKPREKRTCRTALNLPENKFLIGAVAGLRFAKGHHLLLEIANNLPVDAVFVFVGGGAEFEKLQEACKSKRLQERVIMVGHQNRPEDWFPAFDITISPSFYDEGVPQGVMQAMACRIASIATDAGGTQDVVKNNYSGLLIPMNNLVAIQESIEKLYYDSSLREKLAEQGYKTVMANFTQDKMLDAMEDIFTRTIQKKKLSYPAL